MKQSLCKCVSRLLWRDFRMSRNALGHIRSMCRQKIQRNYDRICKSSMSVPAYIQLWRTLMDWWVHNVGNVEGQGDNKKKVGKKSKDPMQTTVNHMCSWDPGMCSNLELNQFWGCSINVRISLWTLYEFLLQKWTKYDPSPAPNYRIVLVCSRK